MSISTNMSIHAWNRQSADEKSKTDSFQLNQFQQKILYEELSSESFSTAQNKLPNSLTHPTISIDLMTDDIEQQENQKSNNNNNTTCTELSLKSIDYSTCPAPQQLKFISSPSTQYIYNLSGEMYIDLRWVMGTVDEETLNQSHILSHKNCPSSFVLNQNKTLMLENEGRQHTIFQFKFLPQMLYSLGTPQAIRMGKLIEGYQTYVDLKMQQVIIHKDAIAKVNMKERKAKSFEQAQAILSKLNPFEFFYSSIGFGDDFDFYQQRAQCFSPSFLEILGISAEEIQRITLRKGSPSFFDWKTQFNIALGRLMAVSRENSQRSYSAQEVEIITFDGFRLKTTLQMQLHPLNENLIPYQDSITKIPRFLLTDHLVIFKFSFHPLTLKQLMIYRQSEESKSYKSNLVEDEFQESIFSSIFLEKYYEKELESLGQKKKKIRKTKAKATEEMSYYSKMQKNKFVISHS